MDRKSEPCDDHVLAAEAQAAALEAEYSKEYLGKLAYAGGFVADMSERRRRPETNCWRSRNSKTATPKEST